MSVSYATKQWLRINFYNPALCMNTSPSCFFITILIIQSITKLCIYLYHQTFSHNQKTALKCNIWIHFNVVRNCWNYAQNLVVKINKLVALKSLALLTNNEWMWSANCARDSHSSVTKVDSHSMRSGETCGTEEVLPSSDFPVLPAVVRVDSLSRCNLLSTFGIRLTLILRLDLS